MHTINSKALLTWSRSQTGPSGIFLLWKKNFVWSNITLTLDLQILFNFTAHPLIIGPLWEKCEPNWTKVTNMLQTRIFHIYLLWPSNLTLKLCSRSLPLHKSSGYVKYELNWEYICSENKNFCVVQYDLDLQTSFKVTAHHFTIGTLWVRYEAHWTKNICPGQGFFI